MTNSVDAWSYSRWADYDRCPLYFKEKHVTKAIKEDQSPAMKRGNDMHVSVAAWLKGTGESVPRDVLKFPRVEQILLELRQMPDKVVEQQWAFTDGWKPTGWFEKKPNTRAWLRVVLDVGLVYPDMSAEALDWKSGKKYGSNADQMELFALAMMCMYQPVKHVTTRLVYFDSGDEDFAEFPATHKQRLIDKWTKKVQPMFSDQVFAPRPNEKCKWCPLARSKGGKCAFG